VTFDPVLVRTLGLLLPVLVFWALWAWRRPDARARAAVTLAFAWHVPALLVVHEVATRAGWWTFEGADGGLFRGLPVDLWIGWCTLWGALPVLGLSRLPVGLVLALALGVDLALMPRCAPVIRLGPGWLLGEGLALLVALLPAQLLARWTLEDRRLLARATLQALGFGGLTIIIVVCAVELVREDWSGVRALPAWWLAIAAQLIAIPLGLGVSAAQELARRGGGTPLPLDPPRRLVTSGPYAYGANPMQVSLLLTFLVAAAALREPGIALAGVSVVAFGAGIAGWSEDRDLAARFGPPWRAYRASVRRWWPRWRPYHPAAAKAEIPALAAARPSILYVADSCGPCRGLRAWLERRDPIGLTIVAAEDHPTRDLMRLTYDPGDGTPEEEGVRALGRALEHLHLGWATCGMALRLPVVSIVSQLLADAGGAGPRLIRRS
jgi:protein-S-isoprenylcysteine O-methyltransferase Ste14